MDTKTIEWCKTILLSQSIIPRLLKAITKENEKMLGLGYGSEHFGRGQGTYEFLESMLAASIRKRDLANLYVVVADILNCMDDEPRAILEQRFFKRKCIDELIPKVNIRTVYRHYNAALSQFACELIGRGYTVEVLEDKFGRDRVIGMIYNRVKNREVMFKRECKPHKKRCRASVADGKITSAVLDTSNMDIVPSIDSAVGEVHRICV